MEKMNTMNKIKNMKNLVLLLISNSFNIIFLGKIYDIRDYGAIW